MVTLWPTPKITDFMSTPSLITVEIAEDGKSATISLSPGKGEEPPTYRKIIKVLKERGVVRGYITENIRMAAEKALVGEKIKVAEWIPPVDGMDAELTYHYREYKNLLPLILEQGPDAALDGIHLIQQVKKGDVVLSRTPPVKGVPGCDVTGKKIPYREGKDITLEDTEYLSVSSGGANAFAARDGQIIIDGEGRVSIRPLMVLRQTSGSREIKFDGSILVERDLGLFPGLVVSGDVEVRGAAQNVPIEAGGNVLVQGPFLLSGGKIGRAEGDFACVTTTNAHIVAKNIFVEKSSGYSTLEAEEEVHTSLKEGKVAGGEIEAGKKAVLGELGNKKEIATLVKVATNEIQIKYNTIKKEKTERMLAQAKERFEVAREVYLKLDKERGMREKNSPDLEKKAGGAKELKETLGVELDRLKTEMVQLKTFKPDPNLGEVGCQSVHAGVRLEMGQSVRAITIPIESPVRFLKRAVGIVTEMKEFLRKEEKKNVEMEIIPEE